MFYFLFLRCLSSISINIIIKDKISNAPLTQIVFMPRDFISMFPIIAPETKEHIIKKYLKSTEFNDNIIFFGPMGSRTGFYLITKSLSDKYSVELIKNAFEYLNDFWGKIPNASVNECGNCLEHNLPQAKEEAKHFIEIIKDWTKDNLDYPTAEENEE